MQRVIAVDLGSHSVRVAVWKQNRGQTEYEHCAAGAVVQDGQRPGIGPRLEALADLFEAEPSLRPLAADSVVMALPAEFATIHRLSMPFVDRGQVERTLPFAVEAEVPFDLSSMVLPWRSTTADGKSHVTVGLLRKDSVRGHLESCAAANLDPSALFIDADVFSAAIPAGEPGQAVAVLDIGHARTLVSVVQNGRSSWCRAIDVGGLAFTRAIAAALAISFEEAERRKHGVEDEPTDGGRQASGYARLPSAARAGMDSAIGLLLAEVRTSLIQAEDTLGVPVEEVLLTGGSARIPELAAYLQQDLGVPVSRWMDPRGEVQADAFGLCTSIGRAALDRSTECLDARIGEFSWRGRSDALRAGVGYVGAGLGTFLVAALVLFAWQMQGLVREQANVEARIFEVVHEAAPEIDVATLTDGGAARDLMAGLTEDAVHRAEVLGDGGGVPPTLDVLQNLFGALPPIATSPVEVSELTITRENVSFQAEADGYATSSATEEKLKAHPRFRSAEKGDETRLANGRVRFPITIALDAELALEEAEGDGDAAPSAEGEEG